MTRPDIEGLKALAEKATPGEWLETQGHPSLRTYGIHAADGPIVVFRGIAKPLGRGKHNAAFIAAARQAVPDLIAYIEELEAGRSAPAASVGREEIARVIDPQTFDLIEHYNAIDKKPKGEDPEVSTFRAYPSLREKRDLALAKADAILTLLGRGS